MSIEQPSQLTHWLIEPLSQPVSQAIARLRQVDDVQQIALMPDVHLAKDVCIGTVVATQRLVYPAAVGGDIGCGMLALAFDTEADLIDNELAAAKVLSGLYQQVPGNKHRQPRQLPTRLQHLPLSTPSLQRQANREGCVQLGTLGRGNHFLEFQSDHENRLWVMIHSGSRAMGQAIMKHHLPPTQSAQTITLKPLDTDDEQGQNYLVDVQWGRAYAEENRLAMANAVEQLLQQSFGVVADWSTLIHCDHNHVQQERHAGQLLWIHRKGAQSAASGEPGIIPGSMGTASFHTTGRGCAAALHSSSHGAGRQLSRSEAKTKVREKAFRQQVGKVWFDHRRTSKLRDEAPAAYKDIRAVMKAQKELVKIERELRPILSYKHT